MNYQLLKTLMARYIFAVFGCLFIGIAAVSAFFSLLIFVGVLSGGWSFLHVIAMMVIAACSAALAAVFIALHAAAGGSFFHMEEEYEETQY